MLMIVVIVLSEIMINICRPTTIRRLLTAESLVQLVIVVIHAISTTAKAVCLHAVHSFFEGKNLSGAEHKRKDPEKFQEDG